jgi:hypothetical protein
LDEPLLKDPKKIASLLRRYDLGLAR